MFFYLSKILDAWVDPYWWTMVPATSGLLLLAMGKRRTLGLTLVGGALVLFSLLSLPALSNGLWRSLENGVVSTVRPDVTYDAVVLLGGAVSPSGSLREEPAWNDNVERLLTVHHVLATGKAKMAVVTGGELGGDLHPEAEYLARELVALGIDSSRITLETKAVNTRENARHSKVLLDAMHAQNIMLVTSAFHMPRAAGCFRAAGMSVDVLPVDFRQRTSRGDVRFLPRGDFLTQSTHAIREWVGRGVYWGLGYSTAPSAGVQSGL
jgi:uncharacterized SAM-binding protein YcdF (DUF218 family)